MLEEKDRRDWLNNFLKRLHKSRLSEDSKAFFLFAAAMKIAVEDGEPEEIVRMTTGHGLDEDHSGGKAALPPPTEKPKEKEKEAAEAKAPANAVSEPVAIGRDVETERPVLVSDQKLLWGPYMFGQKALPINDFRDLPKSFAIGRDIETNRLISVSDAARRRGLYVLGRSGTGKTELLKRLILHDMEKGYGAFFLDPSIHREKEKGEKRGAFGDFGTWLFPINTGYRKCARRR